MSIVHKNRNTYLRVDKKLLLFNKNNLKQQFFFTHDNGGRTYAVFISQFMVLVYKTFIDLRDVLSISDDIIYYCNKPYQVFIGKHKHNSLKQFHGSNNIVLSKSKLEHLLPSFSSGNSILIEEDPLQYVFIGDSLFEFSTDEPINFFFSPIGNSDVPYPYAISDYFTFLLTEKVFISNEDRNTIDPYQQYYFGDDQQLFFKFRVFILDCGLRC